MREGSDRARVPCTCSEDRLSRMWAATFATVTLPGSRQSWPSSTGMANREPFPALLPAGWAPPSAARARPPRPDVTLNPPSTIEIELGFMRLRGLTTVRTYRRHVSARDTHRGQRPRAGHLDQRGTTLCCSSCSGAEVLPPPVPECLGRLGLLSLGREPSDANTWPALESAALLGLPPFDMSSPPICARQP